MSAAASRQAHALAASQGSRGRVSGLSRQARRQRGWWMEGVARGRHSVGHSSHLHAMCCWLSGLRTCMERVASHAPMGAAGPETSSAAEAFSGSPRSRRPCPSLASPLLRVGQVGLARGTGYTHVAGAALGLAQPSAYSGHHPPAPSAAPTPPNTLIHTAIAAGRASATVTPPPTPACPYRAGHCYIATPPLAT